MQQQIWGEVVDFNLAFFSSSENVTVKTLLKSAYICQSYYKKNLAQFFLAHPVGLHATVIAMRCQRAHAAAGHNACFDHH